MIFASGPDCAYPFVPVACPLCGMVPIVYESADRSFFCIECQGDKPAHTLRVTDADEETVIEHWNRLFSGPAPSSAPCAPDPRPEDESCDHRERLEVSAARQRF